MRRKLAREGRMRCVHRCWFGCRPPTVSAANTASAAAATFPCVAHATHAEGRKRHVPSVERQSMTSPKSCGPEAGERVNGVNHLLPESGQRVCCSLRFAASGNRASHVSFPHRRPIQQFELPVLQTCPTSGSSTSSCRWWIASFWGPGILKAWTCLLTLKSPHEGIIEGLQRPH